jgi:hypothetical protein
MGFPARTGHGAPRPPMLGAPRPCWDPHVHAGSLMSMHAGAMMLGHGGGGGGGGASCLQCESKLNSVPLQLTKI